MNAGTYNGPTTRYNLKARLPSIESITGHSIQHNAVDPSVPPSVTLIAGNAGTLQGLISDDVLDRNMQRSAVGTVPGEATPHRGYSEQQQRSGARANVTSPTRLSRCEKPDLVIFGDIDPITSAWSSEERLQGRCTVQMTCRRDDSGISASFRRVISRTRPGVILYIECIYLSDRAQHYITSTDLFTVLGELIGAPLLDSQRSRIRHSLEKYEPWTVHMHCSDSNSGLPSLVTSTIVQSSKIEDTLEVYPWDRLKEILSEVIGRYVSTIALKHRH